MLSVMMLIVAFNGWAQNDKGKQIVNIKGVRFTMVFVEGGTITMGEDYDDTGNSNDEVTLSDYYIGETEVTQDRRIAVM